MKKTTKTKKPAYTIDLVGMIGADVADVKYHIVCAKADAGIVLNQEEKKFLATYTMKTCADIIFGDAPMALRVGDTSFLQVYRIATERVELKKPNIFVRFWNWLTRKK